MPSDWKDGLMHHIRMLTMTFVVGYGHSNFKFIAPVWTGQARYSTVPGYVSRRARRCSIPLTMLGGYNWRPYLTRWVLFVTLHHVFSIAECFAQGSRYIVEFLRLRPGINIPAFNHRLLLQLYVLDARCQCIKNGKLGVTKLFLWWECIHPAFFFMTFNACEQPRWRS